MPLIFSCAKKVLPRFNVSKIIFFWKLEHAFPFAEIAHRISGLRERRRSENPRFSYNTRKSPVQIFFAYFPYS